MDKKLYGLLAFLIGAPYVFTAVAVWSSGVRGFLLGFTIISIISSFVGAVVDIAILDWIAFGLLCVAGMIGWAFANWPTKWVVLTAIVFWTIKWAIGLAMDPPKSTKAPRPRSTVASSMGHRFSRH